MKAIIKGNLLIVNTFDLNLYGKTVFGKILEIDLTERVTLEFEDTNYTISNRPSCHIQDESTWNKLVNLNFEVFNLHTEPQFLTLFEEVANTLEEYYKGISFYVSLYNKLPLIEISTALIP
tara:strand:- start:90726 stop:91088 length:363 start_codon:yes stop_codon:yes gene_type:complete